MGSPEAERIRSDARERVSARPSMVLDGDPVEELARAHERHAERLEAIVEDLAGVGRQSFLGDTSEGRAATHNIGVAVHDHPDSVVGTIQRQAAQARFIATSLREIDRAVRAEEAENRAVIDAATK